MPIQEYEENKEFNEWINSGDFTIQLIECDFGLVEKNRLIKSTSMHLLRYENLQAYDEKENVIRYSFEAVLNITYSYKDGASTEEKVAVHVEAEYILGEVFNIEDVYRINEYDSESE